MLCLTLLRSAPPFICGDPNTCREAAECPLVDKLYTINIQNVFERVFLSPVLELI